MRLKNCQDISTAEMLLYVILISIVRNHILSSMPTLICQLKKAKPTKQKYMVRLKEFQRRTMTEVTE